MSAVVHRTNYGAWAQCFECRVDTGYDPDTDVAERFADAHNRARHPEVNS